MKKLGSIWILPTFFSLLINWSSMLHGADMWDSVGEIMVGVPTQVLILENGPEVAGYWVWNLRGGVLEPGGFVASTAYVAGKRKPKKRSRFRWSSVGDPKETDIYVLTSCFLDQNARVLDEARLYGTARVFENAQIFGHARVYGNARVFGSTRVFGYAQAYGNTEIFGDARVYGEAQIFGDALVFDSAWVFGRAEVYGRARISGGSRLSGFDRLYRNARVYETVPQKELHEVPVAPPTTWRNIVAAHQISAKARRERTAEAEEACTVCLEEFHKTPDQPLFVLSCAHRFHQTCFLRWLETAGGKNTCPICRHTLTENQIYEYKKFEDLSVL